MAFADVGREDEDLADLCLVFPSGNEFVHDSVESLAGEAGAAWVVGIRGRVDPEWDDGSADDPGVCREVVGEAVDDERVGAERKVWGAEQQGADRHEEARIRVEESVSLEPSHLRQAERSSRRVGSGIGGHRWLVLLVIGDLLLAEWIRAPGALVAVLALAAWLLAAFLQSWGRLGARLLAGLLVAKAVLLGVSHYQIDQIERHWSSVREAAIVSAADRWLRDVKYARSQVERVSSYAATLDTVNREQAFGRLARAIRREQLEIGALIVESDGTPVIWAGRYRLLPQADGDSINFDSSPYYAVIESRRHLPNGRTAVASLLLAADSTVPDQAKSLAQRFGARSGVGVEILPAGVAPDTSDVFDYFEPTPDGGRRLLFSVQLRPPTQAASHQRVFRLAVVRLAVLSAFALIVALIVSAPGWWRLGLALLPAAIVIWAPLGDAVDVPVLFSSTTFFHPMLGPFSAAAGPLIGASMVVVLLAAVALGRSRIGGWWGAPVAGALLVAAPYLVSRLGRGIQIPAAGVGMDRWVTWQLAIFLTATALVLIAAALLPAPQPGVSRRWPTIAGVLIAVATGGIGLAIWNARFGWPDWYPLLWIASLALIVWPGRRWLTLAGVGVAVGTAASLMVWGAEVEGRVNAGRSDLASLGAKADPIAVPLLESFLDQVGVGAVPRNTSELFAQWRSSSLSRQAFPASLGLWHATGEARALLKFDELDLPDSLVSRAVRELSPALGRAIVPVQRIPAVHYLALIRVEPGVVMTVALGPRTSLMPQARLGRLLNPVPSARPLYRLAIAPTGSLAEPREGVTLWRREQWTARGSRTVAMGDGARDVNGVVELGQPLGLVVRGVLLVVVDLLVLFGLVGLASWLLTGRIDRPAWWPEWRAFRTRIAFALGVFFLVPAGGFALLNILELANEGRSRRDLVIGQTLRDASPGSTMPLVGGADLDQSLELLSERVDANLVLFVDGRLKASNGGGVFEDFGLVNPLIDPEVFHRIQLDGEPTAVTDGPSSVTPTRLGVRAVRLPTGDAAMLAAPQSAVDPTIGAQQLDLAYFLALAVVMGLVAAVAAANRSARALSRPAADLRDAALAFGRGEALPEPHGAPTAEFEPVFAALKKMAADVRATQEAEERAARVLAWGEMANQVAHEIKNPLTPMRLGIQHLQRVYRDGRPIGPILDETARRILGEIDRLDTIARAFSRFAAPSVGRPAPEPTSLGDVCEEVVALYGLAPDAGTVTLESGDERPVLAHRDELKETLVNLLENARNAGATAIRVRVVGTTVAVIDNGPGIPADRLERIFEPRFSTTTSGSGLGLAIVKRLVEGWGATIEVESRLEAGTSVTIACRPA